MNSRFQKNAARGKYRYTLTSSRIEYSLNFSPTWHVFPIFFLNCTAMVWSKGSIARKYLKLKKRRVIFVLMMDMLFGHVNRWLYYYGLIWYSLTFFFLFFLYLVSFLLLFSCFVIFSLEIFMRNIQILCKNIQKC